MRILNRILISTLIGLTGLASVPASAQDQLRADRQADRTFPASMLNLKLDNPASMSGVDAATLQSSKVNVGNPNGVIIRLNSPSVVRELAT